MGLNRGAESAWWALRIGLGLTPFLMAIGALHPRTIDRGASTRRSIWDLPRERDAHAPPGAGGLVLPLR
jgi:hypothetical protein